MFCFVAKSDFCNLLHHISLLLLYICITFALVSNTQRAHEGGVLLPLEQYSCWVVCYAPAFSCLLYDHVLFMAEEFWNLFQTINCKLIWICWDNFKTPIMASLMLQQVKQTKQYKIKTFPAMPFTEHLNNIPALFFQDKAKTCFAGVTTEQVPHIPAGSPELKCVILLILDKCYNCLSTKTLVLSSIIC